MDAVVMLRQLWGRRIWVVASAVVAIAVGVFMAFSVSPPFNLQSRAYTVGVSSTTAMLDTPSSQVVDLGDESDMGASAATLPGRAALIASVLTTSPLKEQIAKEAGIDPRTLIAGSPAPGSTLPAAPIGSIPVNSREASILTVSTYENLPMLGVSATAPDARTAARLSNGAIKVLIAHVNSIANADAVPADRRLVVKQLGDARVAVSQRGPSRKLAAAAAVLVFSLLCGLILFASLVAANWREAGDPDRQPAIDWDSLAAAYLDPPAPAQRVSPAPDRASHVNGRAPATPPPPPPAGNRWDSVH